MNEQECQKELQALRNDIAELKQLLIDVQLKHMEMMEEHMRIKQLMNEVKW